MKNLKKAKMKIILIFVMLFGSLIAVGLLKEYRDLRQRAVANPVNLSFQPSQVSVNAGQRSDITALVSTNGHKVAAAKLQFNLSNPAAAKIVGVKVASGNTFLTQQLPPAQGLSFTNSAANVTLGALCTSSSGPGCSSTTANFSLVTLTIEGVNNGATNLQYNATSEVAAIGVTGNAALGGTKTAAAITVGSLPTLPPQPTATPVPGATHLNFTLLLHGIGRGGDNVSPTSLGTMNPLRPQRTISVELYNSNNQLTATKQGTVTFNTTYGNFRGVVDVNGVANGLYTVRVNSPQYLGKLLTGIYTITNAQTTYIPVIALVTGDANNDNSLSVLDYNVLLDCFSDLAPARNCADAAKKQSTDITDDGKVNQYDYNLFLRELSVQSGQ